MQDYKAITSKFSVADALSSGDLEKLQAIGFSTIVNNLPDEEVTNGFTSSKARAEAEALGIGYIHLPVTGLTLGDQDIIDGFANILLDPQAPIFAHCKTGTRSAILWGLASSQSSEPGDVLRQLELAGFELDYLDDEFEEQWEISLQRTSAKLPVHADSRQEIATSL